MKRVVMLALVVAGVLMINACQDEEIRVKETVRDDLILEPDEVRPDINETKLPIDTEKE